MATGGDAQPVFGPDEQFLIESRPFDTRTEPAALRARVISSNNSRSWVM